MKRYILRQIIILFVLLSFEPCFSQWIQANGPNKGEVCALVSNGINIFAGTKNNGVFLSTNSGATWSEANTGLNNTAVNTLALSGSNLYAGTNRGIFISNNSGANWNYAGLESDTVFSICLSDNNIYAGTGHGVYFSNNNGISWSSSINELTNRRIISLTFSGNNLFAGTDSNGICVSNNNGISWTDINSGLTNLHINALSLSSNYLFAGTSAGLFRSSDNGSNWVLADNGMLNNDVRAIAVSDSNIFAGTADGIFTSSNNGVNWKTVNAVFSNPVIKTEEVILYELFVRDFTPQGTFNAIIPRLQELKSLGINTIWLMPVTPIGVVKKNGTYGSPYAVKDYYDVNPSMGTKSDFTNLVKEIHKLGMKVIVDWVANHTAWDNSWITLHNDWYTKDSQGNIIPPIAGWTDVADLNYNKLELRQEMIKAMSYWVSEFDIDGYRCDAAEMVPLYFWKDAIDKLKLLKPVLMLAEGEDKQLFNQGFNICFSWTQYSNLKLVCQKGNSSNVLVDQVISDLADLSSGKFRLRFSTNHDETSWDLTPPELFGGIDGAMAASVISVGLKGVPMLYNGQEVGSTAHLNLFEKMNINWNLNPAMHDFYVKLLNYRSSSPELKYGSMEKVFLSVDLVSFTRTYNNARVWIIVNARNRPVMANIPASLAGTKLTNVFTGQLEGADGTFSLVSHGYLILKIE